MSTILSAPKKTKIKFTPHFIGSRMDGGVCLLPDGREAYVAFRFVSDIHKEHEKSISDAMRKGVARWGVDIPTLLRMRANGIKWICVLVRQTGDRFLAPIESFLDTSKVRLFDRPRRGRQLQHFLPFQEFVRLSGKIVNVRKFGTGFRRSMR
jgi:hypothetical protein